VATEARASGAGDAAPEIAALNELNTKGRDYCPWVSQDGLTLYWVIVSPGSDEGEVWTARRKDAGSIFADKRLVGHGKHIAVSTDDLTMFLIARRADGTPGESIHVARRRGTDEVVGRPQEVAELKSIVTPRNLFLSRDGLSLLFNDGSDTEGRPRLSMVTRTSSVSRWGGPHALKVTKPVGAEGDILCPHLTSDGLTLFGVFSRRGADPRLEFMTWGRKTKGETFTDPRPVAIPDVRGFFGWTPRYVDATHELFFSSGRLSPDRDMNLWLVRNFTLPEAGSGERYDGTNVGGKGEAKIGEVRSLKGHTGPVMGVAFSVPSARLPEPLWLIC
jgi:hypothetical protein